MFPAIIDTAVAVSTLMLVALGDKPARRTRPMTASADTEPSAVRRWARRVAQGATVEVNPSAPHGGAQTAQAHGVRTSASVPSGAVQTVLRSAQASGTQVGAEAAQADADLASELIASGVTTQPVETVLAVLAATRQGRRSTLPPKPRESTTAPRSESWRGAPSASSGDCRRLANASCTRLPGATDWAADLVFIAVFFAWS